MSYVREEIRGTSGQDLAKLNENFMNIFQKVFGDINFSDTAEELQNKIMTQYIPVQGEGNLDSNYPLYIRFYVPPNVKKIKSSDFNMICENYRMDSSVTVGGGGVASGAVSMSIASGGGFADTLGAGASTSYVKAWGGAGVKAPATPVYYNSASSWSNLIVTDKNTGRMYGYLSDPDNGLMAPLNISKTGIASIGDLNASFPSSKAGIDMYLLQHTHEIPAHSHNISIAPHSHNGEATIQIPDHYHALKPGIFIATQTPSNVQIYVNDKSVGSINGTLNNQDWTNHINIGSWNTIKITTNNFARVTLYGTIEAIMKSI